MFCTLLYESDSVRNWRIRCKRLSRSESMDSKNKSCCFNRGCSDMYNVCNLNGWNLVSRLYWLVAHVNFFQLCYAIIAFCALTLLVGQQAGYPAYKKTEWWGAGMVIYLERGADLHMAQVMQLPLTVSCFSKIQIGFTFLVPAHLGSPGKRAVKRLCVCVMLCYNYCPLLLFLVFCDSNLVLFDMLFVYCSLFFLHDIHVFQSCILWVKKTRDLTLAHNFTKYWPIFKILSLLDSVGNL